jgi:signal transduction histidine kinase
VSVHPGSVPFPLAAAWISNWIWPLSLGCLAFLFLLFPEGHLPSRRWRPVAWIAAIDVAVLVVNGMIVAFIVRSDPFSNGIPSGPDVRVGVAVLLAAVLVFTAVILVSFGAPVVRYRNATGDERLQLKWFVFSASVVAVCFSLSFTLSAPTGSIPILDVLSSLALIGLWVSIAVAVLKYRLYDIDVVIGRALVFALLAAFITVVYVALVVGVGTLVGKNGSAFLSALAAAIVALAFQPVRRWARKLANRVVYGKRATPYEVLSGFTARASETYSTQDVLPRLVRVLAEGIGAQEARVWLCVGSELRSAASWPVNGIVSPIPRPAGQDLPSFPGPERAFPVRLGDQLLGAITVTTPASDPLGEDRAGLVEDVAAQTALVLQNVRLIEELRESRRRIVAAQDARAKALERNIHDGAQQQLVALAVKQRLAENLVERDPEQAKAMLADIQRETQDALENLRDLARGIYPPLLADQGLFAALEGQARKAAVPVTVEADGIGRYPQDVEAAVYFSCLEALQNIAKYARATHAEIRLSTADGQLRFEVTDHGVGFDTTATSYGTGLQGMADRLDAAGGSLEVRSAPGEGTTIVGRVPI